MSEPYEYSGEEYTKDYMEEDWYYQPGNPGGRELDEDDYWDDDQYDTEESNDDNPYGEVYDVHKDY